MGGEVGILVIVYSMVENWGMISAGWFISEMAEYWGGNVFLLKQMQHTHSFARKSTWQIGFKMALQVALLQATGSYKMGGKSGLSFRGVNRTLNGTTNLEPSDFDAGRTFHVIRTPSLSSVC